MLFPPNLDGSDRFIGTFFGPLFSPQIHFNLAYFLITQVMLSVNLVAISAVMYRLCTVNRKVKTVKSELLRYLRGILCMTALLGLQWGLGFASIFFGYSGQQQVFKFICILSFVFFTLAQVRRRESRVDGTSLQFPISRGFQLPSTVA